MMGAAGVRGSLCSAPFEMHRRRLDRIASWGFPSYYNSPTRRGLRPYPALRKSNFSESILAPVRQDAGAAVGDIYTFLLFARLGLVARSSTIFALSRSSLAPKTLAVSIHPPSPPPLGWSCLGSTAGRPHKAADTLADRNIITRLFYGCYPFFAYCCVGTELFYVGLYLLIFVPEAAWGLGRGVTITLHAVSHDHAGWSCFLWKRRDRPQGGASFCYFLVLAVFQGWGIVLLRQNANGHARDMILLYAFLTI